MTMNPKRQYFHSIAPQWDSFPPVPDAAAKITRYLERSACPGARQILDVGCGTGILLPYLLEMYPRANCFVEFDFAEGMLVENVRKSADARILRVCADVQAFPFVGPSFDLVLCFSVLPHFSDMAPAVERLYQALRPQGVLTVGHLSSSQELNEFHGSLDAPVRHDKLPPASELGAMFRRLGAVVVSAEEEADWYFVRVEKGSA